MRFRSIGFVTLSAAALTASAAAQTPPAPPAVTRTVVAATKLPSVTDRPLLFRALSINISPGEKRVPITMVLAALGGEIEVPTIDGIHSRVKVPEGTQSGRRFRLQGKPMGG
jgi:hypothetical protein